MNELEAGWRFVGGMCDGEPYNPSHITPKTWVPFVGKFGYGRAVYVLDHENRCYRYDSALSDPGSSWRWWE